MRPTVFAIASLLISACSPRPMTSDAGFDAVTTDIAAPIDANATDATDAIDAAPDAITIPSGLAGCTLDAAFAADASTNFAYSQFTTALPLQDRTVYLLTILEHDTALMSALAADPSLGPMTTARLDALRRADTDCAGDVTCVHDAVVPDDATRTSAVDAIVAAASASGRFDAIVAEMRASRYFTLAASTAPSDRAWLTSSLDEAFVDLAGGWTGYVAGQLLPATLASVVHEVATDTALPNAWWSPLSHVVLRAMLRDGRDEAARYGNLATDENTATLETVATIDFARYPYSALIVPGLGPADLTTPLSTGGRIRCDMAAARFRAGLAPLILVSGGHVHPDRTMYSEAIEMKRYLVSAGIPANAVLVDPYARHTTTNIRDATRVLLRGGVPIDRPVLVVSDSFQSLYIQSLGFATRCDTELHYRPWRGIEPRSNEDTCITLEPISLTLAASDLLDP